ncbi:ubiquitin-conjugating enzyme E2A, RAD6 homolog (S. cerevisiae), isoform CRA_c [Rattus norvegicus]|uniref:Ubiquitin-conjugating enzyme E2A, RAD6 homolog (S. cerevisiae), isoform CRA_c n=1 Tax=Rattus norvegicus TaxID=10116 RepID=A6JMG6_RAT|nr:ubiquitin-conjugating enzyme E2A, RAD6 homolog (S. cerevisiae), isoform CRA_c [Rattus norvegicus]
MYIDAFITLFLIHYIYFIKNKIAVVLFLSSLGKFFFPFLSSCGASEILFEIQCTVPGLLANITTAYVPLSYLISSLKAVIRLLYFLY